MSFFQLGGGYLFGLLVGFLADSIGAIVGAGAAFLLGITISFSNFTFLSTCQSYTSFCPVFATQELIYASFSLINTRCSLFMCMIFATSLTFLLGVTSIRVSI